MKNAEMKMICFDINDVIVTSAVVTKWKGLGGTSGDLALYLNGSSTPITGNDAIWAALKDYQDDVEVVTFNYYDAAGNLKGGLSPNSAEYLPYLDSNSKFENYNDLGFTWNATGKYFEYHAQ